MKYAFVGGIPASGKSFLADKVAKAVGAVHADIDEWREEMKNDPKLKRWTDFFWNKDEEEYWRATSCEKHWENLKRQSEALWPMIAEKIATIIKSQKPAIFEGVNILPHLAKDLGFPGIFLLGESFQAIFKRNKRDPRWGQTEELQRKESEIFYKCEGPMYKKEARKYGFKTFRNPVKAEKELLRLMLTAKN